MAKFTVKAGDEYAIKLSRLVQGSEEIAKKAVYAGANIVANEVRRRLESNLEESAAARESKRKRPRKTGVLPESTGIDQGPEKSTGALAESLGIAPIDRDEDGVINAKIGFDGYDEKGVPNQLKARAMESGTSTQQKRPFVRPAVKATRKQANEEMGRVVEEEIKKRMER